MYRFLYFRFVNSIATSFVAFTSLSICTVALTLDLVQKKEV
jgi:hypothetical protein